MTIKLAVIDYGGSTAQLWGDLKRSNVKGSFYKLAGQCFGIRKSIMGFKLLELKDDPFPEVFGVPEGQAAFVLKHNGDTIVWGADGEKIKSEWD